MLAALLCREFKWTYTEYEEQPAWFIEMCTAMLHAEAQENKPKRK